MKEQFSILNENGTLSGIGKFEDFDDADEFLNSNNMLAFYVFSEESTKEFRQSVGAIVNDQGEWSENEFFILNEANRIEYIGEYENFYSADQFLIDNDRDDDSFFIFDKELFDNLVESL
jgi:hypothetical protein